MTDDRTEPNQPVPPATTLPDGAPPRAAAPSLFDTPADDDLIRRLEARQSNGSRSKGVMILAGIVLVAIGVVGGVALTTLTGDDTTATPEGFVPSDRPTFPSGQQPGGPGGDGGGFPGLGGGTVGTITAVDGDTITLEMLDGSTVTVSTTDATTVTVTEDAAVSDLAAGDSIVVQGQTADDGTVTADSISEGSIFPGGGGFAPPTDAPTS